MAHLFRVHAPKISSRFRFVYLWNKRIGKSPPIHHQSEETPSENSTPCCGSVTDNYAPPPLAPGPDSRPRQHDTKPCSPARPHGATYIGWPRTPNARRRPTAYHSSRPSHLRGSGARSPPRRGCEAAQPTLMCSWSSTLSSVPLEKLIVSSDASLPQYSALHPLKQHQYW